VKEEKTTGKSTATFIWSTDKKFMIKTMSQEDSESLKSILRPYHEHLARFPYSLLERILGHYRANLDGKRFYFIVINNILSMDKKMDEVYDLKGSTVGRGLTLKERQRRNKGETVTMKDNDILERKRKLILDPVIRKEILQQLNQDVQVRWS
jgi:1-phosphatidylinositol-4-phosphate 5-kinase